MSKKESNQRWREVNKEKISEYRKKYYSDNKIKTKEYNKEYHEENKDKRIKYIKKRKNNDPLFKLKEGIRATISNSLRKKGFKKTTRAHEILGCSYEDFKLYLESKFEDWMTWDNRGKYNGEKKFGWDIDHIIPLNLALTEIDIIKLNHYTNLQPLCSKINRDIKKAKCQNPAFFKAGN